MSKLIGRVLATEKVPTTMDEFHFWTNSDLKLHAFDIVKVEHMENSYTFGVIENISHITDAQSFLTNYISNDFGDVYIDAPTLRVGMNYVCARVSFNNGNIYTPVHNNAKVYLATSEEITMALGLDQIQNPLVCGSLKMYEGTIEEVIVPVYLNSKFILGPEGAHLNISGISGLAAKTSYAMFLIKAIQDKYLRNEEPDDSIAFVIFNVKGKDLMAIDRSNDFYASVAEKEKIRIEYNSLGLTSEPFKNVKYFIPFASNASAKKSTYLSQDDVNEYMNNGRLQKFKYSYEDDKESLEMLFADIEDPQQTMEAIISKIIDDTDIDFGGGRIKTWTEFRERVDELSQRSQPTGRGNQPKGSNEISVLSWRKFKRIINKATKNDDMFANRPDVSKNECRLADELKKIRKNEVYVVDIAKLPEDKQAFVFGDAVRTIYNLKLGEYDAESEVKPPSRIVIFIDELNKYASKDIPKSSPILREILDITERGRSLGVVLFAAEQFRSSIHDRVTGNCSTHAYGRTNSIETSTRDYGSLPNTYKNMLTRLEQGDYLVQNPIFRSLLKVKFPKPIYKQFK